MIAAQHEAPEPLGWDGIGAIAILLVAALSLRGRVSPDLSFGFALFRVLWWLIYLAATARLVQRFGTAWVTWTIRHQPALCILLTLTVASVLWSLAPALTLQKAAELLGTTVLGVFIGYSCGPQQVMRVLYWTFILLIVSSIGIDLVLPTPVGDGIPMGSRGIMAHKNTFGAAAALATMFFLVMALRRRIHPLWGATLCAVCLLAVAQARSRTAWAALAVGLVTCGALEVASVMRRPMRATWRRVTLGLVLGVSVIPFLVGPLATVLGNDDPLNGRTQLWAGALTIMRERPLTGYGYAVVWARSRATLLPHVPATARRSASSAHNSIIHVATELGLPAAIVACAYLFGALSNAGRLSERAPSTFSFFALVFLVGFTVMGFAEAHLLGICWMFWILFVALTITLKRALEGCGPTPTVAVLTGAANKPYALGLASALIAEGLFLDFIGSDDISGPELRNTAHVNFLNLRGDQSPGASLLRKARRVLTYYGRLIRYAAVAEPKVFHILWNNKFELFDRTLLMLYYRALGRRIVFTAHNVNAGRRDGNDSFLNRLSLRIQYHLSHHIFVHTQRMKRELVDEFGAHEARVSVIPFGINDTIPRTPLTRLQARHALGLDSGDKTILFFGKIAPYKGLHHLIAALGPLTKGGDRYRLVIAGAIKNCDQYWNELQQSIDVTGVRSHVIERIGYIPDEQVEIYFKAADVLALPYTYIFQSGVLFLGYSFGLPVVATDVGSFHEDILQGQTGFMCRAADPRNLAEMIEQYFASELFKQLDARRRLIREYANQRHSWATVGQMTKTVYSQLLKARI